MTRWGAPYAKARRILTAPFQSENLDEELTTLFRDVRAAQSLLTPKQCQDLGLAKDIVRDVWTLDELVYVPDKAVDVCLRILLMAHCGRAGHRTTRVTASRIHQVFTWKGMEADI